MDNQDELFIIVNKNDKIIGYRTRYDCHHNKQLIHRGIGIVIFNDKGQILLQKRSKNKDLNPGKYTTSVSGHTDKGETYQQSATRELYEELGIRLLLKKQNKALFEMNQETEMICLFSAKSNGPFYPNKEEIEGIEFVDINRLNKMLPRLTPFAILSLKKLSIL